MLLTAAKSKPDSTIQLTADDLMTMPPISVESTIRLDPGDLIIVEGGAPEVILRPSELQSLPLRALTAVALLGRRVGRRVGAAISAGLCRAWAVLCLAAVALRRDVGNALGVIGRKVRQAALHLESALRRGWHRIADSAFHLADWAQLKLRRYTHPRIGLERPRLRTLAPADRVIVEDLQRALAAYSAQDPSASKLRVTEIDGRVAIVVPGRQIEVRESHTATEPTLLGRAAMTSTR